MRKAIVTGGAGFIGSNLVNRLIDDGVEVIIIDDLSTGTWDNIHRSAKFHKLDISKLRPNSQLYKDILDDVGEVDTVFHLAAKARVQPSINDPVSYNDTNINGTLNILCLAQQIQQKYKNIKVKVIYSASSSCYGDTDIFPTPETAPTNPLSPYGLQKFVGEQYCKMFSDVYGLDTCSLRYFNVYGERMNMEGAYCLVMGIFAKQMLEGEPLTITNDGKQRRDFTYVGDVVEANILAANHEHKLNGDVFNIGRGSNYSINDVADMFGGEKEYGKKVTEPFETLAQTLKARRILGWEPKGDLPTWIKKYKEDLKL